MTIDTRRNTGPAFVSKVTGCARRRGGSQSRRKSVDQTPTVKQARVLLFFSLHDALALAADRTGCAGRVNKRQAATGGPGCSPVSVAPGVFASHGGHRSQNPAGVAHSRQSASGSAVGRPRMNGGTNEAARIYRKPRLIFPESSLSSSPPPPFTRPLALQNTPQALNPIHKTARSGFTENASRYLPVFLPLLLTLTM